MNHAKSTRSEDENDTTTEMMQIRQIIETKDCSTTFDSPNMDDEVIKVKQIKLAEYFGLPLSEIYLRLLFRRS